MTRIQQSSRTPAEYQTTILLKASPDAVFDALTTVTGLAAWWNPATGSGESGGELRFIMNAPEPLVIHVDEATRPSLVRWTVADCPFLPDWVGTRPTFTITPVDDDTSALDFYHRGLNEELDCIDMCTRSWDHYMTSLRDYLEIGRGSPFGSPADRARRDAQRQATAISIHQEPVVAATAVAKARAHIAAWSHHDWDKTRQLLAPDVHVLVTSTQLEFGTGEYTGVDAYMEPKVRAAELVEPGSVHEISAIGDDHNALILVTFRIRLGPGGAMVTMARSCLYWIDENAKIKEERDVFYVLPQERE